MRPNELMASSDDEEHVVLVADLADPLEVAGGRREAAAGVLHRLEEDRGDGVGALELDGLGDAVGGPAAEGLLVVTQVLGSAVHVGVGHLVRAGHERLEHLLGRRDAGDRQGALGRAVVGDGARDDLVLRRLAGQLEVLLRELPRGLDGLAAAGGEEDAVEVTGGVAREALGQLDRLGVRVAPQREEGELLGLLGGRLGELLAAVADLDDEEAGEAVDVLVAAVVPDLPALALGDDGHGVAEATRVLLLEDRVAREVHPQVVAGGVRVERAGGCPVVRGGFPDLVRVDAHRVPQL